MTEKEYKIEIDPGILELLGPSLYTNIYYVLAELESSHICASEILFQQNRNKS